jgi:hypothetical protein
MQPQRNEKRICKVDVQRKLKVPKMNVELVTGIGKNSSSGRTAHHNGLVFRQNVETWAERTPVGAAGNGIQTLQQREARGDVFTPCEIC